MFLNISLKVYIVLKNKPVFTDEIRNLVTPHNPTLGVMVSRCLHFFKAEFVFLAEDTHLVTITHRHWICWAEITTISFLKKSPKKIQNKKTPKIAWQYFSLCTWHFPSWSALCLPFCSFKTTSFQRVSAPLMMFARLRGTVLTKLPQILRLLQHLKYILGKAPFSFEVHFLRGKKMKGRGGGKERSHILNDINNCKLQHQVGNKN